MANYGSVVRMFGEGQCAIDSNPHFRISIKTRTVQEKVAKMVKKFKTKNRKNLFSSGLGGEEFPMEETLASVVEEMDREQEAERKEKDETTRAEKRKLEVGELVLKMSFVWEWRRWLWQHQLRAEVKGM